MVNKSKIKDICLNVEMDTHIYIQFFYTQYLKQKKKLNLVAYADYRMHFAR